MPKVEISSTAALVSATEREDASSQPHPRFSEIRPLRVLILGLAVLAAGYGTAHATEGGGTAFFMGQKTTQLGIMPAPGFSYAALTTYYEANSFVGSNGKTLVPRYDLNAEVGGGRFTYVLPDQIEGTTVGFAVQVPLVTSNYLKKSANGIVDGVDQRNYGMGDIKFSPINLGWKGNNLAGRFDSNFSVWASAPTGEYEANQPFNITRNYWSYWGGCPARC